MSENIFTNREVYSEGDSFGVRSSAMVAVLGTSDVPHRPERTPPPCDRGNTLEKASRAAFDPYCTRDNFSKKKKTVRRPPRQFLGTQTTQTPPPGRMARNEPRQHTTHMLLSRQQLVQSTRLASSRARGEVCALLGFTQNSALPAEAAPQSGVAFLWVFQSGVF